MANSRSKALSTHEGAVHHGDVLPQSFKALAVPAEQFSQFLIENLGGQGFTPFDLDRIRVPAGGGTTWEVPTLQGPQSQAVLNGIIVAYRDVRSYWRELFAGGSQPPDCSSPDALYGVGTPGGSCLSCPLAAFGTSTKADGKTGKGQACRLMRLLLFLRESDLIPTLVVVPPSSVKSCRSYFLRLVGSGLPYYGVTTNLALHKMRSGDGITYSQIGFNVGRELDDSERQRIDTIKLALNTIFARTTVDAGDVHHD